ncbi:MAG: hypothetical protein HY812_19315 [Planctomycetes bacterium]|nr:hypothetical protein [Planctomycetota bacterium]
MRIAARGVLAAGAAAGLVLLCIEVHRFTSARAAHAQALLSCEATAREAQEVARLRALRATASLQQKPPSDVIALVNEVLAAAGVPSRHFSGLTPEGEGRLQGGMETLREQKVRLTLNAIPLPDLGAFLARFSEVQSLWIPVSFELTHPRQADAPQGGYDVQVVLAAVYHAEAD